MLECYGAGAEKMDRRLNDDYRALLSSLPAAQQEPLRDAQRKWLQYREAELKLAAALDPNAGGSLARVNASAASYEMLERRVTQFEAYLARTRD